MKTFQEMLDETRDFYADVEVTCPGCKESTAGRGGAERLVIDVCEGDDGDVSMSIYICSNCARILLREGTSLRDPSDMELDVILRRDEGLADAVAAAQYSVRMDTGESWSEDREDMPGVVTVALFKHDDMTIYGRFVKKRGVSEEEFQESLKRFFALCRESGAKLLDYPHAALLVGIPQDILDIDDDYRRWLAAVAYRSNMRLSDVGASCTRLARDLNGAIGGCQIF